MELVRSMVNRDPPPKSWRRDVSLHDFDVINRSVVIVTLHESDPLDHRHPAADPPEDGVFAVQPLGGGQRDEELAAITVGTTVGHG